MTKQDKEEKNNGIICQKCLKTANSTDLTEYMFHWVVVHGLRDYQGLFCEHCINKYDLMIRLPYTKKPKSKK